MIDYVKTGEFLLSLRLEKGLNQQQLAKLMNVTHQAVSKWETGSALPDMHTMLALSKLYDVSMEDILLARRSETGSKTETNESKQAFVEPGESENIQATEEGAEENTEEVPALDKKTLSSLLPFLDTKTIDEYMLNALESKDMSTMFSCLPFASTKTVDTCFIELAKANDKELVGLAPFASKEVIDKAISENKLSESTLTALAPFAGKGMLGNLIRGAVTGASKIAKFFGGNVYVKSGANDENKLVKRIKSALEANDDEIIDEFADDLSGKEIVEILEFALDKSYDAEMLLEHCDDDAVREALVIAAKENKANIIQVISKHL